VSAARIYANELDIGMVGEVALDGAEHAEANTPHVAYASGSGSGSGVGSTRRLSDRSDRGALCPLPENSLLGVYAHVC
jgi:hypothetical protein